MRRLLLFLLISPAFFFGQSKKELLSQAQQQSLRNEHALDSLQILISAKKNELNLMKQSNPKQTQRRDSLQALLKTKENQLEQETKAFELLTHDINVEIKRLDGYHSYLYKMITYLEFVRNLRTNISDENIMEDVEKAIQYVENQAELLVPKAIEENTTQAKNVLYTYYFDGQYRQPENLYKALKYALTGKQESECLAAICSNLYTEINNLIEADAWAETISNKQEEFLSYSKRLEANYPKEKVFLNVFNLYDLVNVYVGLKQYEKALSYSNLLLKSCTSKDIQYYHYKQRCDIYIILNKYELALKDSDATITEYKKYQKDLSSLFYYELSKCEILIAIGRFTEANALCDKMLSSMSSKELSRKFMSKKKSWILSKKVVCLYELGKIPQADDIFDFISEYYICDDLIFYCGDKVFDPCIYHETYY
jgi:hypothetical protein